MKFEFKTKTPINAYYGDVIIVDGMKCLIANDSFNRQYPCILVNLDNGEKINGYPSIESMLGQNEESIIIPSEHLQLTEV